MASKSIDGLKVNLVLSKSMGDKLEDYCAYFGISKTSLIENALLRYFETEDQKKVLLESFRNPEFVKNVFSITPDTLSKLIKEGNFDV